MTTDGSWSAHTEHTVAITPRGPWVLTALDGGVARLAELGVQCGDPGAPILAGSGASARLSFGRTRVRGESMESGGGSWDWQPVDPLARRRTAGERLGSDPRVDALREHCTAGRLTLDELDERLGQACRPGRWGSCAAVFHDLPDTVPDLPVAAHPDPLAAEPRAAPSAGPRDRRRASGVCALVAGEDQRAVIAIWADRRHLAGWFVRLWAAWPGVGGAIMERAVDARINDRSVPLAPDGA